ncbi:MAG: hypothetical protein E7373_05390 [Clostridiales bacterium]|nr:hypothetical protein [Clostridiales bacterium]
MKKTIKYVLCFILLLAITAVFPIALAESARPVEWIDIVWGDNSYTEMELPDGFKGKSYPVPNCVAIDNNGDTVSNMEIFVYAPDGNIVVVENDRFATENTGVYKICYSIEYKELSYIKTINVNVVDTCDELFYNVSDKIDSEVVTGTNVILYEGDFGGGLGDLTVDCQVLFDGENYAIQDFGGEKYFVVKDSGVYTLSYTVTDFVGNEKIQTFDITATESLVPIMSEVPLALKNRVGDIVKLPVVNAKLYSDGQGYLVPVKVYYDDVEITNTMSYTAETVGMHTVKYVAESIFDSNYKTEKVYSVEVVDHNDFEKYDGTYHYLDNYITTNDLDHFFVNGIMMMSVKEGKERGEISFASKVNVNFIEFDFSVIVGKGDFEGVRFNLVDTRNAEETVELYFAKNNETKQTDVYINGENVYSLKYLFGDGASELSSIKARLNIADNTLTNFENIVFGNVKTYLNGKKFLGFTSGNVYITMSIEGVSGENQVSLTSIAGMNVTDSDLDIAAPVRIEDSRFNAILYAEINEEITLPFMNCYDFYDENIDVALNITSPSRTSVHSGSITDDYKFTVTEYGTYVFSYVVSDSNYNSDTIYGTINVVDRIAPTITVDNIDAELTVGEKITLPKPVVSDNLEEELSVFVYVIGDNFMATMINLKDYTYTFNKAGNYTIRYVVSDKAMNTVWVEFSVTCR